MKTLALVSAALAVSVSSAAVIKPLILSGTPVPPGTRQYVSGMRRTLDGVSFCGGSLIAPDWVLTAAHCAPIGFVSVGSSLRTGVSDGTNVRVTRSIRHPQYVSVTRGFDYMLLQLERPVDYKPVPLSANDTANAPPGTTSTAMGWGNTTPVGSPSNVLLKVDVPVVSNAQCTSWLGITITNTMTCAGGELNLDSCQSDSGGPLVVTRPETSEDVLVGVVSWGAGCGQLNKPGVYARVSAERAWIDTYVTNATWV